MKDKVKIIKVDIDQSLELARQFEVASVPAMIIFKDGKAVDKMIGFKPKDQIKAQLEQI